VTALQRELVVVCVVPSELVVVWQVSSEVVVSLTHGCYDDPAVGSSGGLAV
jgi:hypothetical protein